MKPKIKEILEGLGDLYSITGEDWILTVHHVLTEPTCPTVRIAPERWNITRYCVHADSIEEAIEIAAAAVRREVIDRSVVGHCAPWTNSDDSKYEQWVHARAEGSDDKLRRDPL